MIQFFLIEQTHRVLSYCLYRQQFVILKSPVHTGIDHFWNHIRSDVQQSHAPDIDVVGSEHDHQLLFRGSQLRQAIEIAEKGSGVLG